MDYPFHMMFSFLQDNENYNTPPKFKTKERDETINAKVSSDCVSFCGDSGSKFVFEVQNFNNRDEEFFIKKDPEFQSKIESDINNKTKGIRNILDKLGTSLERLKGEVDIFINPLKPTSNMLKSNLYSKISIGTQGQLDKENQESLITTTVYQQPPLNIIYGSKHIERSCTKSCSKIKSQIKKYKNNQEFQSFKNLLKDIAFSESNKKNSNKDKHQNIQQDEYKINARRKLDFSTFEDEFFPQFGIDTPKSQSLSQESIDNDSNNIQEIYQSFPKKIFVKDIKNENGNVNYFFIYRTHH